MTVMFSIPKFVFRHSFFRLAAGFSAIFLIFQCLFWLLIVSSLEETFWEANVSELYALTLELERGDLHGHGEDVLWGTGVDIHPTIQGAFNEEQRKELEWVDRDDIFEVYEGFFGAKERSQEVEGGGEGQDDLSEWEIFEFTYEGSNYFGTMRADHEEWQYVALNIDHQLERVESLNAGMFYTVAATFFLAIVISYFIARSSQRKISKIQTALSMFAEGDLNARCNLSAVDDDISSIGRSLDGAFVRLQVVTEQTRLLGRNIAHDLRTPLARLRATLEGMNTTSSDKQSLALNEVDRIASIIDAMMRIARLQGETNMATFRHIDLKSFAQRLYETYAPILPPEKALVLDIHGEISIQADEVLLEQAIANLLQNAIVYGGDSITLFTSNRAIGISDDGPGVPEDQFDEIIKPSVRLDPCRGEDGAGLGLAFVKAVADHHDARLVIEALTPRGLKFSLQFD